jgi:hypothetical protein
MVNFSGFVHEQQTKIKNFFLPAMTKCSCGCGQKATGTFYHQGLDRCHIPGRIGCRSAFFGKRLCPKCRKQFNDWNFSDSTNEWEEDDDSSSGDDTASDSDTAAKMHLRRQAAAVAVVAPRSRHSRLEKQTTTTSSTWRPSFSSRLRKIFRCC